MLDHFPTDVLTLIKRDGTRTEFKGLVDSKAIHTDATSVNFEPGDEVERKLPNGLAEVFVIEDPNFQRGMGGIPDFYELRTSRRGSRKPTPVTNIMNIGSMHGSQIQQGTHASNQSGTFTVGSDHTALLDILSKIRAELASLPAEVKAEAEVYVDAVERQTKLPKVNEGFVRSSLESLKSLLQGTVGSVVQTASLGLLKTWMAAHGIPIT